MITMPMYRIRYRDTRYYRDIGNAYETLVHPSYLVILVPRCQVSCFQSPLQRTRPTARELPSLN